MLQVKQLSFSYNNTRILNALNFEVQKGDHIAVIGESGSGKSTLLKLIYGEYDLDHGHIFWNDQEILGPKYNLVVGYDFIKYVAQEFDLMPYTSVEQNVGKFLSNFFPEEKQQRTSELLEVVELSDFAKTKVKTLSGGQKQRVALARALAKEPELLLLDEPFSHIDNFKKQSLRRSVFNYLKSKNITCIVATHDKNDVLGFSDQILLLNQQEIELKGAPEKLYKNPKSPLIASFFGEFNRIKGELIYAHQLKVVDQSDIDARVTKSYFNGKVYLIEAKYNHKTIFFENGTSLDEGQNVFLKISK